MAAGDRQSAGDTLVGMSSRITRKEKRGWRC